MSYSSFGDSAVVQTPEEFCESLTPPGYTPKFGWDSVGLTCTCPSGASFNAQAAVDRDPSKHTIEQICPPSTIPVPGVFNPTSFIETREARNISSFTPGSILSRIFTNKTQAVAPSKDGSSVPVAVESSSSPFPYWMLAIPGIAIVGGVVIYLAVK